MSSRISIVIPVYNRADKIERTLRSIDAQRVKPDRVIVIDNGSTDDSRNVVETWSRKQYGFECLIADEPRRGACAARNRGLEYVETEFVMFFDSDDEMTPTHIADFSRAIAQNPDCDIFGRTTVVIEMDGRRQNAYFTSQDAMFNHLFRGCMSTQRIVIRTSLIRRIGGWNESLPVWDDYELGARLLLATDKVFQLPGKPSVLVFRHPDSITGDSFSSKAGLWEKTLDCVDALFKSAGRNDLLKWVDCRRMILAAQYRLEGSDRFADELFNAVCSKGKSKRRLQLVYYHNLKFHRLTWLFTRLLFR